jgi:hypothetical protein
LVITLLLHPQLIGVTTLVAIPGLLIVLINGIWIALLVGIFCLRFRDSHLVQAAIQIFMFITPIFWSADNLTGMRQFVFVQLNPVYRLIDVVRAPLLGTKPTAASYAAALAITAVGWCLAFLVFAFSASAFPIGAEAAMAGNSRKRPGGFPDLRSLRAAIIQRATGGLIHREGRNNGRIVVRARSDVSLQLEEGDRLGLIGHNGSGKSTLLKVIAGIHEPIAGMRKAEGRVTPLFDMMPRAQPRG